MKLRYWYKIDHNKQPIPGSNIRRKSRPGATHQWKEILDPCCSPAIIDCTCGPRYFVQLDGRGKPVDHTLIKRVDQPKNNLPEGTNGNKLYEINWKSPCCTTLSWEFIINSPFTGSFSIEINGNPVVDEIINGSGEIKLNKGDSIVVLVTADNPGVPKLVISGAVNLVLQDSPGGNIESEPIIWNNQDIHLFATISVS